MKIRRLCQPLLILLFLPLLASAQSDRRSDDNNEEYRKTFKMRTNVEGRLRLDIDAAEVRVSRATSDDEIRLSLYYTKDQFAHTVSHDDRNNELDITLDKKGWFDHESNHTTARVELELPTEVNLHIFSRIKAGEIDMQLGGMHIVEFALRTWAGEVHLDFDQPNKAEMRLLDVNTKVGASSMRNLGNARFLNADINGGIGEMTIDFRGDMIKGATADVDLDIGETIIILPDKSGTKLSVSKFPFLSQVNMPFKLEKEGRYYYTKNYENLGQTFDLRLNSGIGELRIE